MNIIFILLLFNAIPFAVFGSAVIRSGLNIDCVHLCRPLKAFICAIIVYIEERLRLYRA